MKDVTPLSPVLMLEGGKLQVRCENVAGADEAPRIQVSVRYDGAYLFAMSDEDVTEIARGLSGALDRLGKFVVAHLTQYEARRRQPQAGNPNGPPLGGIEGPGSQAP
jgi:hypothetical protein